MNQAKIILVFVLYVVCLTANGQHSVGVKINGGWSKISTKLNSSQLSQEFKFVLSYQAGLYYNFHFQNKSIIGFELLFSKIAGKEHSEQLVTDQYGNSTGQLITNDNTLHISYLSIPIYYGFNYKKLNFNIGLQTSYTINGSAENKTNTPDGNGGFLNFDSDTNKLPIKNYDFGIRAGLFFDLTKRISLEIAYNYGLTNNYKYSSAKWKIQQFTIGIRYTLLKK